MRYGSVCSGIEAASQAWQPLGFQPAFFSEIDPFPCGVLAHHHGSNLPGEGHAQNGVPNYGDMSDFANWPDHGEGSERPIDILVGGTPCQSFSIAGLRGGLADERGNLMLTYLQIARRYRPRWLVWENVPGVLSSFTGAPDDEDIPETGWEGVEDSDFACLLRGMEECGYSCAWRVLDAQHTRVPDFPFAVPQRRRRLFVVGYLGDWTRAASVLFELESLRGDTPPRREAGQRAAGTISARTQGGGGLGTDFDLDGGLVSSHDPAVTLTARDYKGPLPEADLSTVVAHTLLAKENDSHRADSETYVAHTLSAEGFDAGEDGTGRGTPLVPVGLTLHGIDKTASVVSHTDVAGSLRTKPPGSQENSSTTAVLQPIAFDCKGTEVQFADDGTHPTLRSMGRDQSQRSAGGHAAVAYAFEERARGDDGRGYDREPHFSQDVSPTVQTAKTNAVAFDQRGRNGGAQFEGPYNTANIRAANGGYSRSYVATTWAVRRLTPKECERLQGFPDNHTMIPWRGKPAELCPDGPRYKALGNSMAVNCMAWIGGRIKKVEEFHAK